MSSGQHGQGKRPEGREKNNVAGGRPLQEQSQNVAQSLQSGVEQVGNRLSEGLDSAREEMGKRYRHAEGAVARNPSSSILLGFGVGFGLGVVLTSLLSRREETWAERYLPDSLRGLPDQFRDLPDSVRRMKIQERATQVTQGLPDSLHATFQSLADTIRDLPSSIAKANPYR